MASSNAPSKLPSPESTKQACARFGHDLGSSKYAIVGGAACQLLGSPRLTEDVDFVVPKGGVKDARRLLVTSALFDVLRHSQRSKTLAFDIHTMTSANVPSKLPSPDFIKQACARIGHDLGSSKYAIVGGAACQLLGSPRLTVNVDFVVPRGGVKDARRLLAADKEHFDVDPRTLHTHFKATEPVEIEILSPPGTFREQFDSNTRTIAVQVGAETVSVLDPILILNAKCRSILGRPNEDKRANDAFDVKHLLKYLADARIFPESKDLPNVSRDFIAYFIAQYEDGHLWEIVKYDIQSLS